MYTVSNRPSSIVAKTRRNILQNVERLENLREAKKPQQYEENTSFSVPKPVFQPVNGKKNYTSRTQHNHITPQQEEVIKFIYDSWMSVCKEGEETEKKKAQSSRVVYYESQPNNELKDFTPFDLESWWGKRLFNTITKSIP
ncbi:mapk-regulated corepressor-interacting protein 1-like [Cimex lectularius]|uniref:Uncharacterized protein n=1 Tax=Cimex lectularius TaxID=79782 RepID=A0A8I6TGL7_CIMLE|nr:mapk-regulated corepressor-interacting protein 1-like [Cimex lectularius]